MMVQMKHVEWEGLVFHDIIMPLFMFLAGVSLVLSMRRRELEQSKGRIYWHVLVRVAILWVLGMIHQGNLLELKWEKLEFFSNTLQAIAAGYLGAALILLFRNIKVQILITTLLLILYWCLVHFVPVPDHGAGVLTLEGNLARYVDQIVLGIHDDGPAYTWVCLLYTSPSPRDATLSRMPSSA